MMRHSLNNIFPTILPKKKKRILREIFQNLQFLAKDPHKLRNTNEVHRDLWRFFFFLMLRGATLPSLMSNRNDASIALRDFLKIQNSFYFFHFSNLFLHLPHSIFSQLSWENSITCFIYIKRLLQTNIQFLYLFFLYSLDLFWKVKEMEKKWQT